MDRHSCADTGSVGAQSERARASTHSNSSGKSWKPARPKSTIESTRRAPVLPPSTPTPAPVSRALPAAPAARRLHPSARYRCLPRLRRPTQATGRRRFGAAGVCSRRFSRHPSRSAQARLWLLRPDRPGAGTAATDRPRIGRSQSSGPCAGLEIFRSLAALSAIRDLRAFRGRSVPFDPGQVYEVGCWAHVRRKFYDLYHAHESPLAADALQRIGAFYAIEADYGGNRRTLEPEAATPVPVLCWAPSGRGFRPSYPRSRKNRRWPRRSATL